MPLPTPDRTILAVPPLIVTVVQVRFDERPSVATVEAGQGLVGPAHALGLTTMTQIHHQQVLVMAGGSPEQVAQAPREPVGWQFAAKDGSSSLTVLKDQMTLETRVYGNWDAFAALWQGCVAALAEVAGPSLVTRLGLRYVNRVTPAGVAQASDLAAAELVEPAFLGPSVESALSEFVTAAEGRVTLTFPDGTDALVQYGVVTEGGSQVFVLDIDCFQAQAEAFDPQRILVASATLNERSLQVFQTVLREPLRKEMKKSGRQT